MAQIPGSFWTEGKYVAQLTHVRPNYAFEPSVTRGQGAPRARRNYAPAARDPALRAAAQRGR